MTEMEGHLQRISSALETGLPPIDAISKSWQRSASDFNIDPASATSPRVLEQPRIATLRDQSQALVRAARPEMDRLFQIVRPARYVVLLTDPEGVVIDHRGAEDDAENFRSWGLWLGRLWSENVEGTNGIGTTLLDGRPTTVHCSQHFKLRHTSLSCSGAPIFAPSGALLGVIDVSSFDAGLSERAHSMTGALIDAVAQGIEERLFRAEFQKRWTVAIASPSRPDTTMLLALDDQQLIVGSNRAARRHLDRPDGRGLWQLFTRNGELFRRKNGGDRSGRLTSVLDGEVWPAIVTPPLPTFMGKYRIEDESFLFRPRLDALLAGKPPPSADRGLGLAPATLRRVQEHIEANIDGDLSLEALGKLAGLSSSHFARAFRQSQGISPHAFVLERRLARARQLLLETDRPLSEIAVAVGFADQSHFAQRFRRQIGLSPGQFRKLQS